MSAETAATIPRRAIRCGAPQSRSDLLVKWAPMIKLAMARGGTIVLQFASQLLVGVFAGASGLGLLQIVTSWTCMLGEFLAQGLPTSAMRRVAIDYHHNDRRAIEGLLQSSQKRITTAWLLVVGIALVVLATIQFASSQTFSAQDLGPLATILAAAPIFALMKLYAESLKSTGRAMPAVCIESATSPVALLVLCLICWILDKPAVAVSLIVTFALSLAIAFIALRLALRKRVGNLIEIDTIGRRNATVTSSAQTDLFSLWSGGVLSIAFLHLPFLLMPLYITTAEIGVFSIAHKMVNVITTILLMLAAIYGPAFAIAAGKGDALELSKVLARTQIICSAIFVPLAAILILFANPLAGLFGEEFAELQWFLIILCAGQLVNAITGLSGVLLNMSGSASLELKSLILAITLALAGSLIVGPAYGATGLAAVFSISIAVKNIASYTFARKALQKIGEKA